MLLWPASRSRPMAVLRRVAMTLGCVAGANTAAVLVEVDVTDPVQLVLDPPVAAQPFGDLVWSGVGDAETGDGVDGFAGALPVARMVRVRVRRSTWAAAGKPIPVAISVALSVRVS